MKVDLNGDTLLTKTLVENLGVQFVWGIDDMGWALVEITNASDEISMATAIEQISGVLAVDLNYIMQDDATGDPYFLNNSQWYLNGGVNGTYANIGVSTGSIPLVGIGSPDVDIVVMDSGLPFDANGVLTHDDLRYSRLDFLYNFVIGETINDTRGHGTKVYGLLAATVNNGIGIRGVASGCDFAMFKIGDVNGHTSSLRFYSAMKKAVDAGAEIVSFSYSCPEDGDFGSGLAFTRDALNRAAQNDVILVLSAGNDNSSTLKFPASLAHDYGNTLVVGSVNKYSQKAPTSNYGSNISVVAPGETVVTTLKPNGYTWTSGTSFATPLVAGVAALILSEWPNKTPTQVCDILKESSIDLGATGRDNTFGYGLANAFYAIAPPEVPANYSGTIVSGHPRLT